jgi:hypothetical protein
VCFLTRSITNAPYTIIALWNAAYSNAGIPLKLKRYNKGRLSRQELLANTPHIYNMVEYHENRCAYQIIKKLIHQLNQGKNENILKNIREILAFDNHFRILAIEKSICKTDVIDFLFGLPLQKTLPRMGLKVIQ